MTRREFFFQWLQVFGLLAATYNPTGWCYLVWVYERPELPASVVFVCGSVLIAGYVHTIRSALYAFGPWHTTALFIFLWFVLWMLSDLQFVRIGTSDGLVWSCLIILSLTLCIAKSWPELRRSQLLRSENHRRKERDDTDWLEEEW